MEVEKDVGGTDGSGGGTGAATADEDEHSRRRARAGSERSADDSLPSASAQGQEADGVVLGVARVTVRHWFGHLVMAAIIRSRGG